MDERGRMALSQDRQMLSDLRGLGRVRAPRGLMERVLSGAGLGELYWHADTPIGRVYIVASPRGIAAVMPAPDDAAFETAYRTRFGRASRAAGAASASLARRAEAQLRDGRSRGLSYDLPSLSEFERAVLMKALEIPRGEVRPYAWVAREIGRPGAVRAVGSALAGNPVPLLIPCHRVVRSDGEIGRYGLGDDAKRTLLREEGVDLEGLERLARVGVRYFGSDTTGIFCFPTCRHARRITDSHRVGFGSSAQAATAGYRPCLVCRPAVASPA